MFMKFGSNIYHSAIFLYSPFNAYIHDQTLHIFLKLASSYKDVACTPYLYLGSATSTIQLESFG